MTEKRCRKCGTPLSESNWNVSCIRKHDYICRPCKTIERRECAHKNVIRERISCRNRMRRWRDLDPERARAASRRSWESNKENIKAYSREYSKRHRDVKNAQQILSIAVKRGVISKLPCMVCGNPESEAHHGDYSKPLDVVWFCPKHHRRVHVWIN